GEDQSQATSVAELAGDDLGVAHVFEDPVVLTQRRQNESRIETEVDGLRLDLATRREMGKRAQGGFQRAERLVVRGTRRLAMDRIPEGAHAAGRWRTALPHPPPRGAWSASHSTWSASRSAYIRSIASTIRACRTRRRSWSNPLYATSCVSACVNVYSISGKSFVS